MSFSSISSLTLFISAMGLIFAKPEPTKLVDGFVSNSSGFQGKCVVGDCISGAGAIEFGHIETKYSGEFLNGLPHGTGVLSIYGYHRKFDGVWNHGVFIGRCLEGTCNAGYGVIELMKTRLEIRKDRTFNLPSMWRGPHYYVGSFKDFLPDGFGTVSFMSGATTGYFQAGKLHGYAEFSTNDGERYRGEYINNNYEGQGVYVCADERHHFFENCKSISGKFSRHSFISGKIEYRDGKVFTGNMSGAAVMNGSVKCPGGKEVKVNFDKNRLNSFKCGQ